MLDKMNVDDLVITEISDVAVKFLYLAGVISSEDPGQETEEWIMDQAEEFYKKLLDKLV